ncbi:MAG TPA: TonB family protein [Allosphingosinicella sp.]
MERGRVRDRLKASASVAALHLLLAYALVASFGVRLSAPAGSPLKLFDVIEPPPPPETIPEPTPAPRGEAAPPSRAGRRAPTAPAPVVPLPVPKAPPAGAAPLEGPSTGTGGSGRGTGSGGDGTGTGSGLAARAVRIGGSISGATDYPRSALRAGIEGSVSVRFVVGTDGRVGGCRVTRSSGHAELDAITCRLIEARFRYRPARDADGTPVPETVARTFDWLLPFRR